MCLCSVQNPGCRVRDTHALFIYIFIYLYIYIYIYIYIFIYIYIYILKLIIATQVSRLIQDDLQAISIGNHTERSAIND
jgi:hypothetical protein